MTVQELLNAASQKLQTVSEPATTSLDTEDPLIGLFSGSVDLATRSEEILEQEISSGSGFTWRES